MSWKHRIAALTIILATSLAWTACNRGSDEATHWDTTTGAPQQRLTDRTTLNQQAGMAPAFEARLAGGATSSGTATIEVAQQGLQIVSPDLPPTPNDASRGFVEYRVDGGAPQYTSQTRFSVSGLAAGERDISVRLVDTAKHGLTGYKHVYVKVAAK